MSNDAISRQAAIDDMCKHFNYDVHDDFVYWNREHVLRVLKDLPSAQQEIIHCKDCIHWINKHLCEIWSRYGTIETKPDFYCGFGERINNE